MKIGLITEIDIRRKEAWSGTILHMVRAVERTGTSLEMLGPVCERETIMLRRVDKVLRRLSGQDPMLNRARTMTRRKGRKVLDLVRSKSVDVLFAPVGSTLIADLPPTGIPVVYCSDATVRLMLDYYDWFGTPSKVARERAIASEGAAMRRADLLTFPTEWAARSAIDDYGIDPDRVFVQPFGANMDDPPPRTEILGPRAEGPFRLLFCGVQWKRKGGDIVLDAAERLIAAGVDIELTILGCTPPAEWTPSETLRRATTVIPFLDKKKPDERARFREIFARSDLLVLPTQAECYGVVFCEAAAFGTVSFGTATGGVPEVIREGETGFTLPPGASGAAYAEAIGALLSDPVRLDRMRHAARDDFETRLNWTTWAEILQERMLAVAEGPSKAAMP